MSLFSKGWVILLSGRTFFAHHPELQGMAGRSLKRPVWSCWVFFFNLGEGGLEGKRRVSPCSSFKKCIFSAFIAALKKIGSKHQGPWWQNYRWMLGYAQLYHTLHSFSPLAVSPIFHKSIVLYPENVREGGRSGGDGVAEMFMENRGKK